MEKELLSETQFKQIVSNIFSKVVVAFDNIDPDLVEANYSLDNITITFFDKTIFVINRQPPVRQIWLAAKDKGYHFNYNAENDTWISTKTKEEFFDVLTRSVKNHIDIDFSF